MTPVLQGVFTGPVRGLRYETPTCQGLTDNNGEFRYRAGEVITFSVGGVILGNAKGAQRINLAQLISRVAGNLHKLKDPTLTNIARLLHTLSQDGDVSNGVTLTPQIHSIVDKWPVDFWSVGLQEEVWNAKDKDPIIAFSENPRVLGLLKALNESGVFTANTPRRLSSAAAARNEVRRNILGIQRFKDVKIPLRNGSYLFADVFRPAQPGRYPVIMNCGVYGRAFVHYSRCDEEDAEKHEQMEERYFFGNPDAYMYENHETVNSAEWVPQGYACVRVDSPGTGKSPGEIGVFGLEEAEAFYDAIQWAGVQPWSNGNIGLWGMSYYAVNQYGVASLQPSHLKAMVSIGTDVNMYEEFAYNGGILNEGFWPIWWENQPRRAICGDVRAKDFMGAMKAYPFNDLSSTKIYGRRAELFMTPDMSKVTTPQWVVMATTHPAHFHQLGSSEAHINSRARHKKLDIWEDWFKRSYAPDAVAEHMAFFDYWLKGVQNGIMDKPPVRVDVRTGNGAYYVQEESEWPIARTRYTRWHLDASPSGWAGDGRRKDFLRLSLEAPARESKVDYSAEVDLGTGWEKRDGTPAWATGVSFISDPVAEEMVLAGYMKAGLWMASTSSDMDIYVSVRIIDANNREIDFSGPANLGDPTNVYPLGKGWLKVSHRKVDPDRSTEYTVKHTHREADYAPLRPGEIVPVEVEVIPNTALIRKGQRIRVDIQPYEGAGHGSYGCHHAYDTSYHNGARNSIYTGPKHQSYVQLPIVPAADRASSEKH